MHHPRCLDPKSQSGKHPFPHDGGCYLGRPGHCDQCPHRGQRDPRFRRLQRMSGYARRGHADEENYPWRPGNVEDDVADFLWPPNERRWIERKGCWAERAAYHAAIAEYDLIRELLREIHDLKKEISDGPDRQADSRDRAA